MSFYNWSVFSELRFLFLCSLADKYFWLGQPGDRWPRVARGDAIEENENSKKLNQPQRSARLGRELSGISFRKIPMNEIPRKSSVESEDEISFRWSWKRGNELKFPRVSIGWTVWGRNEQADAEWPIIFTLFPNSPIPCAQLRIRMGFRWNIGRNHPDWGRLNQGIMASPPRRRKFQPLSIEKPPGRKASDDWEAQDQTDSTNSAFQGEVLVIGTTQRRRNPIGKAFSTQNPFNWQRLASRCLFLA